MGTNTTIYFLTPLIAHPGELGNSLPSKTLTFPTSTVAESSESFLPFEHLSGWLPLILFQSHLFSGPRGVLGAVRDRVRLHPPWQQVRLCVPWGWAGGRALGVSFLGADRDRDQGGFLVPW